MIVTRTNRLYTELVEEMVSYSMLYSPSYSMLYSPSYSMLYSPSYSASRLYCCPTISCNSKVRNENDKVLKKKKKSLVSLNVFNWLFFIIRTIIYIQYMMCYIKFYFCYITYLSHIHHIPAIVRLKVSVNPFSCRDT